MWWKIVFIGDYILQQHCYKKLYNVYWIEVHLYNMGMIQQLKEIVCCS